MRSTARPLTVHLIPHSHTDLGYTSPRAEVARAHADFLREVVRACRSTPTYRWQMENFWQLEQFLATAGSEQVDELAALLRSGQVGGSASYLNLTEVIDAVTLDSVTARATDWFAAHAQPLRTALTADINGYSWGYADILARHGVQHLFSSIHAHHGLAPGGRDQRAFWWEGPTGGRVLAWVAPHYQLGNDLGFCPRGAMSYTIRDAYDGHGASASAQMRRDRMADYLDGLAERDYPYSVVPALISGAASDNAPPDVALVDAVRDWNERHPDGVQVRLSTADEFFDALRDEPAFGDIPTERGDWTDWWADGVASTPRELRVARDAQRRLERSQALAAITGADIFADVDDAQQQLAIYAEHTWGHSHSVLMPWLTDVVAQDVAKTSVAAQAHAAATAALTRARAAGGETFLPSKNEPLRYRAVNTSASTLSVLRLHIDDWLFTRLGTEPVAYHEGRALRCQSRPVPRGVELLVELEMPPGYDTVVEVREEPAHSGQIAGVDRVADVSTNGAEDTDEHVLEGARTRIVLDPHRGIAEVVDLATGRSILRGTGQAPFAAVHSRWQSGSDPVGPRMASGRNRTPAQAAVTSAKVTAARVTSRGPIATRAELQLSLPGFEHVRVELECSMIEPLLNVSVRCRAAGSWEAENLLLPLPFGPDGAGTLWVEKTGALLRPAIDQIHGTLQDYLLLQRGFVQEAGGYAVAVATPDTPLISLGGIDHRAIRLNDGPDQQANQREVAAWALNTTWETNFRADVSGFHEFRFHVAWGEMGATDALERACALGAGPETFRVNS
ncbi:hypothetical protein IM660_01525 [Ruania alkalisoli]|uniref:Glycoside hydrolase family 38 N-terminal domain-containing protein n=1 Tax=Ruania alkalisoli TaxID=2779775 RepID=A0A7M1SWL6_9MICO|nr:hypothetical protein [Ruania alkalisoli]QOR71023.1 hypothetical protein IM660_01525 [Ruania alkalisoli]